MRWLPLALALFIVSARVARADDVLFYWVDNRGNGHATQNLDEVPEPFRAAYRARLKELEEEKKKQANAPAVAQPASQSPPVFSSRPSLAEREIARQKQWRAEIAKWRTELRLATEEVQRIQTQIDQTNLNPILRTTPQVHEQLAPLEEQKQKALARLEIARKKLAEELPQRAKRESVPPRWFD